MQLALLELFHGAQGSTGRKDMAWKRLGAQIIAQACDAEVMLADLHLGMYYTIGGSGTEMWNAIDGGCSREQIVRRLEAIYEASPETLAEALTEFVDTLVDFDLVKPSGALVEAHSPRQPLPVEKRPFVVPIVSRFQRSDPQLFERYKTIKWQPARAQIAWNSHEQDVTVVQVDRGIIYKLSGTAREIWQGLRAGYTRQALIDELSQRFPSSTEQITSDLDQFISELAQCGLVQPADSESNQMSSLPPSSVQKWETPKIVATEDKDAAIRWISTFHGWEPAAPRIAAEIIDNEVVIVDLKAGIYNSITGSGTVVWQALSAGQLRDEVVKTLLDWFDVSADEAAPEVDLVLRKLVEGALIRPRNSNDSQRSQANLPIPAHKAPFERSQITSYNDMEDVLRLDPVHDFDEYGWPKKG
jgi:hypothetical protein